MKENTNIATGTTTAKVMTKKDIKENKMFAIRESIEKEVKPLGEVIHKFDKSVSEITIDELGFSWQIPNPNFIATDMCSKICDTIMQSRRSADAKLYILHKLELLVYYVNMGGYLTACSNSENRWNKMVRHNADMRIAMCNECEKRGLNNK